MVGERDLKSVGTPLGAARHRWRDELPALLLLLVLAALALARPLESPDSARGVAYVLAAQSLASDLDARFGAEDVARFRGLPQGESTGVLLAASRDGEGAVFPTPLPVAALAAPFARLAGLRGVALANILFLVIAMSMAARTLRQRLDTPWRLLVAFLLGSVALRFVLEPRPEAIVLAAVVAAFALAFRSETPSFGELPQVYDRPYAAAADPRFAGRWLVVGALLGLAVLSHPLYLLLVLPAVLALPPAARRGGSALLAAGLVLMLVVGVGVARLLGGPIPWVTPLALFAGRNLPGPGGGGFAAGDAVPSILAAVQPALDLSLLGWNALFLALGRSVGALPYFLPLLLILALWEPAARRSTLVVTGLAAAVLAIVVWPFDYAGDATLGNAWWLPVYGALWLVPTRRSGLVAPLAVVTLAGLVLWPSWLESVGIGSQMAPRGAIAPLASRWLPHESTRRPVGEDFFGQEGVRVLVAGGAASERRGQLFLVGGRWGDLVVASPRPIERLFLAFDGQAGSELDVVGGELGNTAFGPDGSVGFEILLAASPRRHPMWFSTAPQSLYDVRLRLPRAPAIPVGFRMAVGDAP